MAKEDTGNAQRKAISTAHKFDKKDTGIIRKGQNVMHSIGLALKQTIEKATGTKQVRFSGETYIRIVPSPQEADDDTISVIYDSGADRHYITKEDRKQAQLPILRKSSKKVNVANGKTCKAQFVTQLPFQTMSMSARTADTFKEFPHSLMSVGKTADNGMISIFTKSGVTVHK